MNVHGLLGSCMLATVGSQQSYVDKMIVNVNCKRLRCPCPHSFPLVSCALCDIVRVFAGGDASISWSWGSERVALSHPNAYRNWTLLFTNQSPTLAQISVFYPVKMKYYSTGWRIAKISTQVISLICHSPVYKSSAASASSRPLSRPLFSLSG